MILAQVGNVGDVHPATWVAVASGAVTTLGLIVTGLFAWLGSRDRNRIGTLEEQVAECKEQHAECEEERKASDQKCDERHASLVAELARKEAELKLRDERDKAELLAQINALRAQLNQNQ